MTALSTEHAGGVERTTFDYSTPGKTTVRNALGRATTFTFDPRGREVATASAATTYCGATAAGTQFVSDTERVSTDESGYSVHTLLDTEGNPTVETFGYGGPSPRQVVRDWDPATGRLRSRSQAGSTLRWGYSGPWLSRIESTNDSSNGPPHTLVTTITTTDANADGIPEQQFEDGPAPGTGDGIRRIYNSHGDLVQVVSAAGTVTFGGYNGLGLSTTVTDERNQVTALGYDARGRQTSITRNGITDRFAYQHFGQPLQAKYHEGRVTTWTYDAAWRMTLESSRRGASWYAGATTFDMTRYTYDLASNRKSVSREVQAFVSGTYEEPPYWEIVSGLSSSFDYDEASRMRAVRGNGGQSQAFGRDGSGLLRTTTDATGRVVQRLTYDEHLRPKEALNALNHKVVWAYDPSGNVGSITDHKNNRTDYTVDGLGRLWRLSSPDTGVTTFNYDSFGQLSSVSQLTDARRASRIRMAGFGRLRPAVRRAR
jgi:YD repeat-containing protein